MTLYVCNKAKKCDNAICEHREPHKEICLSCHNYFDECNCAEEDGFDEEEDVCTVPGYCFRVDLNVTCIPHFDNIEFIKEKDFRL